MNIGDAYRRANPNGVRVREDGRGDPWSAEHRTEVGNEHYLHDIDGLMGITAFASNTGNRLFVEYVPDGWENRHSAIREFGLIAVFDRKSHRQVAMSRHNSLCTAFYLNLCRKLSQMQPVAPKFFFVCGRAAPWEMIELDIRTAAVTNEWALRSGDWKTVWEAAGLVSMRQQLEAWVLKRKA